MVNILVMQKICQVFETDGRTYSASCQNFYLYKQNSLQRDLLQMKAKMQIHINYK